MEHVPPRGRGGRGGVAEELIPVWHMRAYLRTLTHLLIECDELEEIPSLGRLTQLEELKCPAMKLLTQLPDGICELSKLKEIYAYGWEASPLAYACHALWAALHSCALCCG